MQGIYALITLGPAVLFGLFTLVIGLLYPLTRRRVEENREVLLRRRAVVDADVLADPENLNREDHR
ncbi:hypothetical protein HQQ80_02160 [Microbacteriaceae bacterium VKM Ac-2855]|nr:hypothetical protein [Microbacteriaceae bacterium VKM Ac-2855]